jgi:hypothetical protein
MDNLVRIQLGSGETDQDKLLQKLIKMKLSPLPLWKIAVLGMKKPCWCRNMLSLAHAGILLSSMPEMCPFPMLVYTFLHAGNVRRGLKALYFVLSCKVTMV